MAISTGPGVTHAEAFQQMKDRVSAAALHGPATLTAPEKMEPRCQTDVKVRGRNERRRDRCSTQEARIAHITFHGFINAPARAGTSAQSSKNGLTQKEARRRGLLHRRLTLTRCLFNSLFMFLKMLKMGRICL